MGESGLQACEPEILVDWFGGNERLSELKQFLIDLTSLGVTTIIVTYGIPKLVKILLERTGFLDSKYGIRGIFGCVKPGILYKKSEALREIYETMTSANFDEHTKEIFFVDDSRSNIEDVGANCGLPDKQNVLIDKTTAMVVDTMQDILSFYADVADSRQQNGPSSGSISMPTSQHNDATDDPGFPIIPASGEMVETASSPSGTSVH